MAGISLLENRLQDYRGIAGKEVLEKSKLIGGISCC
jgi:hypothetical protein